ncbi:hypothetical protein [Herpetosiphon geysericola]|uniref:Uncharacterized protein n=1 Tax=Herpetosiphon geysericola TaxID=70996 RepID=A0A0P6YHW9_9CHLR|nr:hypothetical protein [Herpetosiphon geysericola]KPL81932.1 hypothetical protein SE18_20245 [Herpetosiphon geysericola]
MKCPNCYSNVANSSTTCPRCDWPLRTPPASTASAAFGQSPTANAWGRDQQNDAGVWEPSKPAATAWEPSAPADAAWNQATQALNTWEQPAAEPASTWDQSPMQSVAAPPNATMMGNAMPTSVPLTGGQKAKLLFGAIIPLIVITIGILYVSRAPMTGELSFVWIFIGVLSLIFGWQAITKLIDFFSGVALVQVDRLTKTQIVKNKNSRNYYGHFERIGRLNIGRQNYDTALQGAIYQVTYSARSKSLWAMQQVG